MDGIGELSQTIRGDESILNDASAVTSELRSEMSSIEATNQECQVCQSIEQQLQNVQDQLEMEKRSYNTLKEDHQKLLSSYEQLAEEARKVMKFLVDAVKSFRGSIAKIEKEVYGKTVDTQENYRRHTVLTKQDMSVLVHWVKQNVPFARETDEVFSKTKIKVKVEYPKDWKRHISQMKRVKTLIGLAFQNITLKIVGSGKRGMRKRIVIG